MQADTRSSRTALPRLFLWCHTTSRQPFETGVQRVTRRLGRALTQLGIDVVPVGRDDRRGLVAIIGRGFAAFESALDACGERPLLFVPEITAELVALGADPLRLGRAYGMRTLAFVHDLIPLKLSAHYDIATVAMFEAYYASLAQADAVLATTEMVAGELRRHLEGKALRVPPVGVVPLPAQFGDVPRILEPKRARGGSDPLKLITVGSWEPRKNLPRLLRAVARAQRAVPAPIVLTLVGRRGLFPAFDAEVEALLAQAATVTMRGPLADPALAALIADSDASVYPSWEEGFGLPIGESLWLGTPCVCHNGSAMAETAPGGGTLPVDMTDEEAVAAALVQCATQATLLPGLAEDARHRRLASWLDYAAAVTTMMNGHFGPPGPAIQSSIG